MSLHARGNTIYTNNNINAKTTDINNNTLTANSLKKQIGNDDHELVNDESDANSDCYCSSNEHDVNDFYDDQYPNANLKNFHYNFYKPDDIRRDNINRFKNIRKRVS